MARRWILIGVVVGMAVVGEAAMPWIDRLSGDWDDIVSISILLCHGNLLGFWAALGGRATPWRLIVAVIITVVWTSVVTWSAFRGQTSEVVFLILFAQIAQVSVVLMVARFFGLEMADTMKETEEAIEADRQWMQFSLWSMLSWTAATAVLLATLHYSPWRESAAEFARDSIGIGILFAGNTLLAFGTMWIALASRWMVARYIALGVVGVVVFLGLHWMFKMLTLKEVFGLCLIPAAYLALSFFLIRLAGYQLVWRRRVKL